MSIKILQPGLFSTVQDLGRKGYEHIGFSGAGAMDQFSFKVAQSLINNDGPAIEYTLIGPTIQFNTQNTFVITGGSVNASLNNKTISMNSVILAEKGDILKIGAITKGARGYLTFGHTINVPPIAESYATHTRSSIGGFKGRKLM